MFTLMIVLFVVFILISVLFEIIAFVFDKMTNVAKWLFGSVGGYFLIAAIILLIIAL